MKIQKRYVVIDDDEFNNMICNMVLERMPEKADITTFTDPFEGFRHIATEYASVRHTDEAVVFLDLHMPGMTGWEFLDEFDKLGDHIKRRVSIYILSGSADKEDMARARFNKNVQHYLVKPLTKETIRLINYSQHKMAAAALQVGA
jgi:CheY-like chemotaxis protein